MQISMAVLIFLFLLLVGCECRKESQVFDLAEARWGRVQFGGDGEIILKDGVFRIGMGVEMSGIRFEDQIPTVPYSIELEARRITGTDFFCGLTFPVRSQDECLTLILGGWGGGTVGLSSIDEKDASENETTSYRNFEAERWYHVKLIVTDHQIHVELDGEAVINYEIGEHNLGLRPGSIDLCAPLGLTTFQTQSEIRNLRWSPLN